MAGPANFEPSIESDQLAQRDSAQRIKQEANFLFWTMVVFWLFFYSPRYGSSLGQEILFGAFLWLGLLTAEGAKIGLQLGLPGAPYIAEKRFGANPRSP